MKSRRKKIIAFIILAIAVLAIPISVQARNTYKHYVDGQKGEMILDEAMIHNKNEIRNVHDRKKVDIKNHIQKNY